MDLKWVPGRPPVYLAGSRGHLGRCVCLSLSVTHSHSVTQRLSRREGAVRGRPVAMSPHWERREGVFFREKSLQWKWHPFLIKLALQQHKPISGQTGCHFLYFFFFWAFLMETCSSCVLVFLVFEIWEIQLLCKGVISYYLQSIFVGKSPNMMR